MNNDCEHWVQQLFELLKDFLIANTLEVANSGFESSNPRLNRFFLLHESFENGEKALSMLAKLLGSQMALSHFLKSVESELLRFDILGLGPLDQECHQELTLLLQLIDFGEKISLPLQSQKRLLVEVERLEYSLLHLLIIFRIDIFGVIEEVLFEEYAGYLSDLLVIVL